MIKTNWIFNRWREEKIINVLFGVLARFTRTRCNRNMKTNVVKPQSCTPICDYQTCARFRCRLVDTPDNRVILIVAQVHIMHNMNNNNNDKCFTVYKQVPLYILYGNKFITTVVNKIFSFAPDSGGIMYILHRRQVLLHYIPIYIYHMCSVWL